MNSIILNTATNYFNSKLMNEMNSNSLDVLDTKSLLSLLAMNTNAAIRMYTDHKKWELKEIKIDIDIEQDESENIKSITRKIAFLGNLKEEQKMRLLAVVDTCSIQKSFSETVIINSVLL
jgi:putative redox protein